MAPESIILPEEDAETNNFPFPGENTNGTDPDLDVSVEFKRTLTLTSRKLYNHYLSLIKPKFHSHASVQLADGNPPQHCRTP